MSTVGKALNLLRQRLIIQMLSISIRHMFVGIMVLILVGELNGLKKLSLKKVIY